MPQERVIRDGQELTIGEFIELLRAGQIIAKGFLKITRVDGTVEYHFL